MAEYEIILKLSDAHRIKDKIQEHAKLICMCKGINGLIREDLLSTINSIKQILEKAKLREGVIK